MGPWQESASTRSREWCQRQGKEPNNHYRYEEAHGFDDGLHIQSTNRSGRRSYSTGLRRTRTALVSASVCRLQGAQQQRDDGRLDQTHYGLAKRVRRGTGTGRLNNACHMNTKPRTLEGNHLCGVYWGFFWGIQVSSDISYGYPFFSVFSLLVLLLDISLSFFLSFFLLSPPLLPSPPPTDPPFLFFHETERIADCIIY